MYEGRPAYPPDGERLLVGSAWQGGIIVLRWPFARPSVPLDTLARTVFLTHHGALLCREDRPNYLLNLFVARFDHRVRARCGHSA